MTLKKTLNKYIKFKDLVLVFISILSTKFGDRVLRAFFVSVFKPHKNSIEKIKNHNGLTNFRENALRISRIFVKKIELKIYKIMKKEVWVAQNSRIFREDHLQVIKNLFCREKTHSRIFREF